MTIIICSLILLKICLTNSFNSTRAKYLEEREVKAGNIPTTYHLNNSKFDFLFPHDSHYKESLYTVYLLDQHYNEYILDQKSFPAKKYCHKYTCIDRSTESAQNIDIITISNQRMNTMKVFQVKLVVLYKDEHGQIKTNQYISPKIVNFDFPTFKCIDKGQVNPPLQTFICICIAPKKVEISTNCTNLPGVQIKENYLTINQAETQTEIFISSDTTQNLFVQVTAKGVIGELNYEESQVVKFISTVQTPKDKVKPSNNVQPESTENTNQNVLDRIQRKEQVEVKSGKNSKAINSVTYQIVGGATTISIFLFLGIYVIAKKLRSCYFRKEDSNIVYISGNTPIEHERNTITIVDTL